MNRRTVLFICTLLFFVIATRTKAQVSDQVFDSLVAQLKYQLPASSGFVGDSASADNNNVFKKVHFSNGKGKTVEAIVVYPLDSTSKHPGIVYQHWGYTDMYEFADEAKRMAAKGFVSISVNAPWLGPDGIKDMVGEFRTISMQAVVNMRIAMDLLAKEGHVDITDFTYVGHSFGATIGGPMLAAEPRFKRAVLMAGAYNWNKMIASGRYSAWNRMRQKDPKGIENMFNSIKGIQSDKYLPHIKIPLLLQFGREDKDVQLIDGKKFAAICNNKKVFYYKAGHGLNAQAEKDRINWILSQVKKN